MATWCVYCRNQIPDNAAQCPSCGKPLTDGAKVIKCGSCGNFMLKNAAACSKCGAMQTAKRQSAKPSKPVKQPKKAVNDDEDDEDLRRWAGIVALILGVVGFLTGFIGVGIYFDILAIGFGLFAIISKRQKSGLGIAGLCVGAVALISVTVFASVISSIFGSSEKVEPSSAAAIEQVTSKDSEKTEPQTSDYQISDTGFYYYTNSIGSVEYRAYVEITNTGNTNLYLADCTFDLEDDTGHLLQTDSFISSCPDVIAPGEKGYFYNGIGSTYIDDGVSLEKGVNFSPQVTIKESNSAPVNYEVTDTELKAGTFGYPTLTGRVKNGTSNDESLLYIEVIYYNANGKVLEITGTNLTDFDAGKTMSFEISGVGLGKNTTMDSIATYKVIARASHYQF